MVTIYIVLGILYESYIHPLTILTGLPSAVVGALLALRLFGMDLSRDRGDRPADADRHRQEERHHDDRRRAGTRSARAWRRATAIYEACLLRFRPIMMTTLAALMGTLPIALGTGASAELRQPLGVAVVGGLLVSQVLTLFITPVLYIYMERLSQAGLGLVRRMRGKPEPTLHEPAPAQDATRRAA